MKTWFKTCNIGPSITPVNVIKETALSLTIEGSTRQRRKSSDYESYFPTLEDAKKYLVGHCRYKIEQQTKVLEYAKANLEKATAYCDNYQP